MQNIKKCIKFNCAVCKDIRERKVFESILERRNPETYICQYVQYEIVSDFIPFYLDTLDNIPKGRLGYYVLDMFTGKITYLKNDNFRVLCLKEGVCNCETYVAEYK